MPFRLTNAPSTFHSLMNQVFFNVLDQYIVVYLMISSCIVVASRSIYTTFVPPWPAFALTSYMQKWRNVHFFRARSITWAIYLAMARSARTWPSWRPFVNGPHPPFSDIYSSSLACATTIASMWTILHVLLPPARPFSKWLGLVLVYCWVVCIWQPQDCAYESSSPLYPCSWQAFHGEDRYTQYPHWGCIWAV